MKNFIQKGEVLQVTLSADTDPGAIVTSGDLTGICVAGGKNGETVSVNLCGVYELAKGTATIGQGVKCYVNATGNITNTATSNTFVGYAFEAAATGDNTILVLLARA